MRHWHSVSCCMSTVVENRNQRVKDTFFSYNYNFTHLSLNQSFKLYNNNLVLSLPGQWLCVCPDGSVQVWLTGRNTSSQPAFLYRQPRDFSIRVRSVPYATVKQYTKWWSWQPYPQPCKPTCLINSLSIFKHVHYHYGKTVTASSTPPKYESSIRWKRLCVSTEE